MRAVTIACSPATAVLVASLAGVRLTAQDTLAATAFVNVAVVPMDTERVLTGQTVVVQAGRITALGLATRIRVPAGAVRIDGQGKYLIPGLADMHAHTPSLRYTFARTATPEATAEAERMLFLWLANGVTTVRLMHKWSESVRLKDRAAKGELWSPRIYAATSFAKDTLTYVQDKAAGFDFVKGSASGSDTDAHHIQVFDAQVAAARRAGLPVAGHVPPARAIAAQVASIEHLRDFGVLTGDGKKWEELAQHRLDEAHVRTVAAALKQAGVWLCPTSILYEAFQWNPDTVARWPELRYLSKRAIEQQQQSWMTNGPGSASPAVVRRAIEQRRRVIKLIHEAGAGLLLGTDAPAGYAVPGFAVHRELEIFVQAGLTPYQALATGTRNVATYFDTLDSAGTVAVGKRADLVLLNDNPLQDIRHTAQPAGVMLGGQWLSRAELDRGLVALEGKAF
jgi:imidazolonepropionase-like amidohydrolase